MKIKIAVFNFIIVIVTFALAAVIDVISDEENPGVILAFLLEAAAVIAIPIFNYRHEKEVSSKTTAKQYNKAYYLGYFPATAAVMAFISIVDLRDFFPERDGFVWLDLRGLGLLFLAYIAAGGFVFALIFRGAVWLIKRCKK